MCLICIEYSKRSITSAEAVRNLNEMREVVGEDHYNDVYNSIYSDYLEEQSDELCDDYYEKTGFGD